MEGGGGGGGGGGIMLSGGNCCVDVGSDRCSAAVETGSEIDGGFSVLRKISGIVGVTEVSGIGDPLEKTWLVFRVRGGADELVDFFLVLFSLLSYP